MSYLRTIVMHGMVSDPFLSDMRHIPQMKALILTKTLVRPASNRIYADLKLMLRALPRPLPADLWRPG